MTALGGVWTARFIDDNEAIDIPTFQLSELESYLETYGWVAGPDVPERFDFIQASFPLSISVGHSGPARNEGDGVDVTVMRSELHRLKDWLTEVL